MNRVRPAAVAGVFYPGDRVTLEAGVRRLLADAVVASSPQGLPQELPQAPLKGAAPKALIVPHAGYIYSGPVAARAFSCVAGATHVRRVVLIGPAHRAFVYGVAIPGGDTTAFATPLGNVPLDAKAMAGLRHLPHVVVDDDAHKAEHSLEVQIPFLQILLKNFFIVPLLVGEAATHQVAGVLDALWGGPETLIVVSSDLSHYHSYATSQSMDRDTADAILALRPDAIGHDRACGATPVRGLLEAAGRRGLHAELLGLQNSGDTAGDRSRVVGYGAFALLETRSKTTYEVGYAHAS
ncbi:MAG: AmmeMemoRadiSam system protein B [Nitrospirota bacterium]|nr:AmmeMemoRadiSam system protein B [Nitrospirota bacterium]